MTIKEIKARVKNIEEVQVDYEDAHIQEDKLYSDFVKWIAKSEGLNNYSAGDIKEMADEILKTKDFDFIRHCA